MNLAPYPVGQLANHSVDLQDYFENLHGRPARFHHSLQFDDRGAFGSYEDLTMRSVFQPLFDSRTLIPVAYEALLRVTLAGGGTMSPEKAFTRPSTADQIIFFDRLCRTIHALNFVSQAEGEDVLYLNVHGRHLLSVGGGAHGSAFETLLGYIGLKPSQVVLEIVESGIEDLDRLEKAVAAYQKRGYRVAIDDFGCQHSNFDRLWRLSPDIVKLDRSLLLQSVNNPRARLILPRLVEIMHDLGATVVCEGIETKEQHQVALDAGVDLLQGFYYARPRPLLRPDVVPETLG